LQSSVISAGLMKESYTMRSGDSRLQVGFPGDRSGVFPRRRLRWGVRAFFSKPAEVQVGTGSGGVRSLISGK
jgi:hypothetical protein